MELLDIKIRKAIPDDAEIISQIWEVICAERIYSAVSTPFTVKQEREYISSLSEREGIFIAEFNNRIVGFQSLDLWSKVIDSFNHVCTIGTFILPEWRGKGISHILANHTFEFAKAHDYDKMVIYVRKGNERAIKFYQKLGFLIKGELKHQVLIDDEYENEVFMEKFL